MEALFPFLHPRGPARSEGHGGGGRFKGGTKTLHRAACGRFQGILSTAAQAYGDFAADSSSIFLCSLTGSCFMLRRIRMLSISTITEKAMAK